MTISAGDRYATTTVSHASSPLHCTPRLVHRYHKPATTTTVTTMPAVDSPRVTIEILKAGKQTWFNTNQAINITNTPPMHAATLPTNTPRNLVVSRVAGVSEWVSRTGVESAGGLASAESVTVMGLVSHTFALFLIKGRPLSQRWERRHRSTISQSILLLARYAPMLKCLIHCFGGFVIVAWEPGLVFVAAADREPWW